MTEDNDQIFRLEGDNLHSLPYRAFREGIKSSNLEQALQDLLAAHPELLSGRDMNPEDPPRFLLLGREVEAGGGSLDLLFVDQHGILTLVEAKLAQNPEASRAVVGQVLEYAASAAEQWKESELRERAQAFYSGRERGLEEELERFLAGSDMEVDAFWSAVEDNLASKRIRLIIAADEIRPQARRIIELLNGEMSEIEVLGLEVRCYGESASELVVVPRVLGQTQVTADRRAKTVSWSAARLRQDYEDLQEPLKSHLLDALDFAEEHGVFLPTQAKKPCFGLRGRSGDRILSFMPDGSMYCWMNPKHYPEGEPERDRFVGDLKALGMFAQDFNASTVVSGRNLERKLTELSEEEQEQLLATFLRFCAPH